MTKKEKEARWLKAEIRGILCHVCLTHTHKPLEFLIEKVKEQVNFSETSRLMAIEQLKKDCKND